MQRTALVLLFAVTIVSLAACQGGRRIVSSSCDPCDTPGAEVAVGDVLVVDETAIVIEETEGFEATPEENAAADDMLGEAAELSAVEADRREYLVASFVEKAEEATRNGDIDGAMDFYAKALDLDPSNEAARNGLALISSDRASSIGEYVTEQSSAEMVRRQKAAAEVRNYMKRGQSLESREDYAGAVKEYQKALAIISWYDETADFGMSADRIRDLIDQTKYKAEVSRRSAHQEQIRAAQAEQEQLLQVERERRVGRMQAYFQEANQAFRRGEYAVAREYMRQVLREDPNNADAERLITISHDAQHIQASRSNRRQFDDQWKAIMQQMEFSSLPQVRTVEFPEDWLETVAVRSQRAIGDVSEEEDEAGVATLLATIESRRVQGLNWEDASLDDAVAFLRTITGLNFFITAKAREEKGEEVAITMKLDDVTVASILDIITEQNGLKWIPEGGVIKIALAEEISGTMRLRYFDVKDLNVAIQNFVGQEINLTPSNFTPPEPPELAEPVPIFPAEALPELIQSTIGGEEAWGDDATIEQRNGILIVRQTKQILDQIAQLLDELRANTGILVNLEVRFLTAEDNFLRDIGVDLRGLGDNSQGIGVPGLGTPSVQDDVFFGSPGNPSGVPFGVNPEPSSVGTANDTGIFYNDGADGAYMGRVENLFDVMLGNPETLTGSGGLSFQHTFLDDTQMEVILRAVDKSERLQQITAPRVTVYNTQRANVQVLNQVAYVADYEVEIAQASNIANPVVQTILDGVVLDVKPVVSADRRFINLELRPTVAVLTRPIATFSTSLASGPVTASAPVVIQIPELQVSRVRTTVNMPDGGTLLLGGLKFYEQETLESGTPFLSDIPIIGFLLSRKANYVSRRDLLVLIRAEIVNLEELEPRGQLPVPPLPETTTWVETTPVQDCPAPAAQCQRCGTPRNTCGCR